MILLQKQKHVRLLLGRVSKIFICFFCGVIARKINIRWCWWGAAFTSREPKSLLLGIKDVQIGIRLKNPRNADVFRVGHCHIFLLYTQWTVSPFSVCLDDLVRSLRSSPVWSQPLLRTGTRSPPSRCSSPRAFRVQRLPEPVLPVQQNRMLLVCWCYVHLYRF